MSTNIIGTSLVMPDDALKMVTPTRRISQLGWSPEAIHVAQSTVHTWAIYSPNRRTGPTEVNMVVRVLKRGRYLNAAGRAGML